MRGLPFTLYSIAHGITLTLQRFNFFLFMTERTFKVTDMLPVQQGESERGPWRSQDIIVESTENVQYPDRLLLRFSGNGVEMLAGVKVGMVVRAWWSANVRVFKTRDGRDCHVQELRCWKIEPVTNVVKPNEEEGTLF